MSGIQMGALVWLCAINLAGFVAMGLDKSRARRRMRRIEERTLFGFGVFGGSPGVILGMWLFHHKTRHLYFVFGIPAILAVQIALAMVLVHFHII